MDLSRIRADLEAFAQALSREEYLHRSGLKEESQAAAIRDRFPTLHDPARFRAIRAEAQAAPETATARRLSALAEFLGETCVAHETAQRLGFPGYAALCRGLPAGEILAFTALRKLWYLRRYAAKLACELRLHAEGPAPRMAEVYRDLMSEAVLVAWPGELYLHDLDPFFYAARYLRAWIFEAQLRHHLRERFDEEWYRNNRTGPYLVELWRQGQRYALEELAERLGLGPLSIAPLLKPLLADLS